MEAPLGVGARPRAKAPDSRGRGRGAGGRARKPGWEAGAEAAGSRDGRRGATARAGTGTQTGRAVPGHRGKAGADGGLSPKTPVSRAFCRAKHPRSGQRQRGTPGRIGRVCRGKTGAIRGQRPGFRAAYRGYGPEKAVIRAEKTRFSR